MTTVEMWTWIGSIGGGLLGIMGGIIGSYFSIKNTNGPRERQFTIKASAVCGIACTLFVILLLVLPRPYNALLWIPYVILLPISIKYFNKTQFDIRRKESAEQAVAGYGPQAAAMHTPPPAANVSSTDRGPSPEP